MICCSALNCAQKVHEHLNYIQTEWLTMACMVQGLNHGGFMSQYFYKRYEKEGQGPTVIKYKTYR